MVSSDATQCPDTLIPPSRSPISAPRTFGRSNTPLDLGTTMEEAGVDAQSPHRPLIPESAYGNQALEAFEAPPMPRHPARPTSAPVERSHAAFSQAADWRQPLHAPLQLDPPDGMHMQPPGNAIPPRRIPARVVSAGRARCCPFYPTLEATQGQIDGFLSQHPYKSLQNRVAYVGD